FSTFRQLHFTNPSPPAILLIRDTGSRREVNGLNPPSWSHHPATQSKTKEHTHASTSPQTGRRPPPPITHHPCSSPEHPLQTPSPLSTLCSPKKPTQKKTCAAGLKERLTQKGGLDEQKQTKVTPGQNTASTGKRLKVLSHESVD
ncbi:unnamed protein product, partial [Pleuronectes platessa]